MSGWISSKLKVAETFLQQIDQQAAESLGKNERPRSEELSNETPTRTGEIVPLKDQLKKKTSDNGDLYRHLRTDSDSNRPRDKELGSTLKTPSPSTPTLTDSDWTELLGAPKQPSPSAVNRSNGVSAIRGPQKDGRKPGNFGLNSLPSEIKKNQNSHSSVSKFTQRLDIESENRVNGGVASSNSKRSDEEEAGLPDSVLLKFSPYSPKDDGYAKGRETGANLLLELKVDKSQERKGVLDTNGNSKQSHSEIYSEKGTMGHAVMQPAAGNHMSEMEPGSGTIDGIADMKRQVDGDHDESRSAPGRIDESNAALASSVTRDLHNSPKSDEGSDLDSDSASTSDSENEDEKRAERARRRERIMAEKAAAKAVEAIKERENIVARLEGEKQSLEKILEERARQQAQEASELQMSMMETMEAVDLEKQKHNNTRMEALSRLAKLETANAELARSLATTQWNLEIEVNRVAALRQQIELKEMAHEDLRRRMSTVHQSGSYLNQLEASKGVEFEREILEAEYSFICDKIGQLQEKAMKLEENIEMTRKEIENPTEVEVELKRRLAQLTDHLIQKQAQVEALSSEKATLLFRIETVSRLLDENKLADSAGPSARNDLEAGMLEVSNSKLKSQFEVRIRSGGQHFRSLLWQLDVLFSAGAAFLRRNSVAKLWSLVYLVCLHFWVVYILMSHSPPSDETKSGAIISLGSINKTAGV